MLHSVEHRKRSNGRLVPPQFVGVNSVWDVIICEQTFKKGLRGVRVALGLQEHVQRGTGIIDGPPQPEFLTTDLDAYFIQKPPRTPAGFSVAQFFSEEWGEFDVPLT